MIKLVASHQLKKMTRDLYLGRNIADNSTAYQPSSVHVDSLFNFTSALFPQSLMGGPADTTCFL